MLRLPNPCVVVLVGPSASGKSTWAASSGALAPTMWVHGHAGWLQASTGFVQERLGYFLRLKSDTEAETWIHYAIPIALGGQRLVVSDVSLQLRTWGRGEIGAAHLWDGSARLAATTTPVSSPYGVQRREHDELEGLQVHALGLSSEIAVSGAVAVSVLVRAHKARDAIAIAGVGVTVSPAAGAPIS